MIQIPGFLRIEWVKGLITVVFIQLLIGAFFTSNLYLFFGILISEAAILALIYIIILMQRKREHALRGESIAFQVARKGLIFTTGGQDDTLRISLNQQKPDFVAFICSKETKDKAEKLSKELGFDADHYWMELVDPRDVMEIQAKTEMCYNWLKKKGIQDSDVAVDITGGTKPMSVGAFLMAEEKQIDSQYIFCRQYENNKCVDGTQEALLLGNFVSK
jgi:hypothetical protein